MIPDTLLLPLKAAYHPVMSKIILLSVNLKGDSGDCSIHIETRNVVILTVLNKTKNDALIDDTSSLFQNIKVGLT